MNTKYWVVDVMVKKVWNYGYDIVLRQNMRSSSSITLDT